MPEEIEQPGAIATDFGGRSFDFTNDESLVEYQDTVNTLMSGFEAALSQASPASVVAEVIWSAVTDVKETLRYTASDHAKELMANRKALDDATFIGGLKKQFALA